MKQNRKKILQLLNSIANNIKNEISLEFSQELNNSIIEFYNLDSLEFMQFISAIEQEFNIEFPEDITFEELNNIPKLIDQICNQTCNR